MHHHLASTSCSSSICRIGDSDTWKRWSCAVILTIGSCFLAELIFAKPNLAGVAGGFLPSAELLKNKEMLFIAIGILGATVMPHNLYLHSSIVQTRNFARTDEGKSEAITFATIDSTFALMFALFINGGILILSAANISLDGSPRRRRNPGGASTVESDARCGHCQHALRAGALASGQNSTLTGTLAGQIVMEGFLNIRLAPWLRRLITRLIAIVPAVCVIGIFGEGPQPRTF
jgi:manganese transport protein